MTKTELIDVLDVIAKSLTGERNRFGKLETLPSVEGSEKMRKLMQSLGAENGGRDKIDQAVYVASALVAKERGLAKPIMPEFWRK